MTLEDPVAWMDNAGGTIDDIQCKVFTDSEGREFMYCHYVGDDGKEYAAKSETNGQEDFVREELVECMLMQAELRTQAKA